MEIKFEKSFGPGKEPWYVKYERWAKKQRFPISFLALGVIAWLKEKWIEGKVDMEMTSVDAQAAELLQKWEEDAKIKSTIKSTPSEVKGLDDIEINYNE
jgi:hypothetical protein|tara:strand:+ start:841 stop:1137 length:297 start_codon:yes stop_codon:yes gene_type:complete